MTACRCTSTVKFGAFLTGDHVWGGGGIARRVSLERGREQTGEPENPTSQSGTELDSASLDTVGRKGGG